MNQNLKISTLFVNKNKGFSLIEVLVTIAIIAILSTIASINYRNYSDNANAQSINTALVSVAGSLDVCTTLKPLNRCDTWEELKIRCNALHPTDKKKVFTNTSPSPSSITENNIVCVGKKIVTAAATNNGAAATPEITTRICIDVYNGSKGKIEGYAGCADSKGMRSKVDGTKYGSCDNTATCIQK